MLHTVFQLSPVQENMWYLYQHHSRRSKQQIAEYNTRPGINNFQGNGLGQTGSCFKTLKMGEVPHVKNRKCGPIESAFLFTVPIPALQLPAQWLLHPSHFLSLRTERQRLESLDLNEITAAFARFNHIAPSFAAF